MKLQEYFNKYPRLVSDKRAFLERKFVEQVFYPEFGENGLDVLFYQWRVFDTTNRRRYYIDFVIKNGDERVAIELDGYNYHGKMTRERFEIQEDRNNAINKMGYKLLRYSHNKIMNEPERVRAELARVLDIIPTKVIETNNRVYRMPTLQQTPYAESHRDNKKKKNLLLSRIVGVLVMLITAAVMCLIFWGGAQSLQTKKNEERSKSIASQIAIVDDFVEKYEQRTGQKITNLQNIDITDTKSEYYRSTEHVGYVTAAKHGETPDGEIWILRCYYGKNSSGMRIYQETTNYQRLVNEVKIITGLINKDAENAGYKIFDWADVANSQYGYVNVAGGSFVALRPTTDKSKWRMSVSYKCSDYYY